MNTRIAVPVSPLRDGRRTAVGGFVAVPVFGLIAARLVQDDAEQPLGVERAERALDEWLRRDARAHDQEHAVALRGEHADVRERMHGRHVDDDAIEPGPQHFEGAAHRRRAEQLGRLRGRQASRQHGQVHIGQQHQRVFERGAAAEHVHEAGLLRDTEQGVRGRVPQVGVDQHDLAVELLRHRQRQVGRGDRLAVAFCGTGHQQHAPGASLFEQHEPRAQRPVSVRRSANACATAATSSGS